MRYVYRYKDEEHTHKICVIFLWPIHTDPWHKHNLLATIAKTASARTLWMAASTVFHTASTMGCMTTGPCLRNTQSLGCPDLQDYLD